jgi:O-antigen ligase
MLPPTPSAARPVPRLYAAAEWGLILGLTLTFVGTTLCLGGYLAQTMAIFGPVVLGLGAAAFALWAFTPGPERRVLNLAALLPVPFLAYALAGTVGWAPAEWLAWREWLLWFQMWLVFVIVLHFGRSRAHTGVIVGSFALLVVVGFGMAVYQRFSDPHWIMLGRRQSAQFWGRSSGMFGIPNSFAGLLGLTVPVCLTLLFSRAVRPGVKIVCAWIGGLGLVALVLTVSRGAWLGLALALVSWPLVVARRWMKKLVGVAVVALLLGGGLAVLYRANADIRQRLEPFFDGRFELSRPKIWSTSVRIWEDHPWMGLGPGSFVVAFDRYRPPQFHDAPLWAHNDYLNTLVDYGAIGLLLWGGAGLAVMILGWRAIQRSRRTGAVATTPFGLTKWKLGLWLGLLAFALHLAVDFHTKIPALAYAAAIVMALMLREEPGLERRVPRAIAWAAGTAIALLALFLAVRVAWPAYRAEGLRWEARRAIDRYATCPSGDLRPLARASQSALIRAVRIDPSNAQAWADLAYATTLAVAPENRVAAGHAAELAADRALALCPSVAEFWVRKGAALDLQRGRPEAEDCFKQATMLAPNSGRWWYHYAYHLQAFPERRAEAEKALATCLTLDPYYPPAERLRQRIFNGR